MLENMRSNRASSSPNTHRVALLGQCILNVMDDDLRATFADRGIQNTEVLNWSAPGVAIKDLVTPKRLDHLVSSIKANHIDTVIIFKGGNDLLRGRPIDDIKRDLDLYITRVKETGASILLVGLEQKDMKGLADAMGYPAEYMQAAEAMYKGLAEKHQVPLYASFFAGLKPEDYLDLNKDYGELLKINSKSYQLTTDNGQWELVNAMFDLTFGTKELHPNHSGQAKIAAGLTDAMLASHMLLPQPKADATLKR